MVALLLLAACGQPSSEGGAPGGTPRADNFSFETFDGGVFALGEHRGTPVVLNFWESW